MENLRAAGQALVISLVLVLALLALWNLAPLLLAGIPAGATGLLA